jgi:hypothetical protein
MAVPTERSEDVAFPRPLPHPAYFAWATWVVVCGLAYWGYVHAARSGVSLLPSAGFWILTLVVIPVIVRRSRERTAGVMTATIALLGYLLLMQDTFR